MNPPRPSFRIVAGLMLMLVLMALPAYAQPTLTVINPPQGGRVIYGQIKGESTEAGAMAWMMRTLHKEFDDRPEVGKLFQVRGTESVAAFFSLTNRVQRNAQLTGLMIATKTATDHVEGAVVYDEASRFQASFNPLLKALLQGWHPFASARAAAPIPPMHRFTAQDGSISVDLPDGWTPDPTSSGGTLAASGSNGEVLILGLAVLAHDTGNPMVQQTMRTLQQGGLRSTAYATAFYYPHNAELKKMFVETMQFIRHKRNLPSATIQVDNASPIQMGVSQRGSHINAHLDAQDGKGNREMNAIFCVSAASQAGGYLTTIYCTSVPVGSAEKERAILAAILGSVQVDLAIVQREAAAIAGPAIESIREIGKRAADQARAAHQANEIHNSSVYQRWNDLDKRSQEFENYQLGYSVVNDIPNNAHGTLWNQDADRLVKQDPQRFEYVNAPDFWKGIDY